MARQSRSFRVCHSVSQSINQSVNQSFSQSVSIRHVWDARDDLARSCTSAKHFFKRLRKISGFRGGAGFMAQEIMQDVSYTSLGEGFPDLDLFCSVGPGARRGLNRLHGRSKTFGGSGAYAERCFLKECLEVFHLLRKRYSCWCEEKTLSLHDVQFSLCEFDKHMRIRCNESGRRRRYRHE